MMNDDIADMIEQLEERVENLEAQIDMVFVEVNKTNELVKSLMQLLGHKPTIQLAPVYPIKPKD